MHKMKKPSGAEVEVNESSLEYALILGWKKVAEKKTPKKAAKKAE